MASTPITAWQIEAEKEGGYSSGVEHLTAEKVEVVTDLLFLGSKITEDGDCSHEMRRHLLLGLPESYDRHRWCIEKQRHHSATKVHIIKAMVFLAVTYSCESWTIKKMECGRTDAFELWCWRRLLRVPGTAKR